jgi:hypothetical protein
MRRIIYASAAAAVLASSSGCQQAWDSFRRFECWKHQALFGSSSAACEQTAAMPVAVAAPICQPIDAYSPAVIAAPVAGIAPAAPCACGADGFTTVPTLPGAIVPSTTFGSGTVIGPLTPGPAGQ